VTLRERLGEIGLWTFAFDTAPWAETRDTVAEIEALGYGALWIPETFGKDPFASATLLLDASERIAVGTGIASIHARGALAMRAGWATLSEAFPGRFVLGLGVSHAPMVEGMHGKPYERPLATMRAYLDAMDAAPSMVVGSAEPPRRVLAALGPKMLALAAERADGAHPYNVTPEHTASARETLGPDAFLAPEQKVVLATDADEARRVAREVMSMYVGVENYTNSFRRQGFADDDLAGGGSDRFLDALVLWGDDEKIAAGVRRHLEAGADHVAVQVATGYSYRGIPMDAFRRLAPALIL
jgi:probable F420-dependent oxidoreductase